MKTTLFTATAALYLSVSSFSSAATLLFTSINADEDGWSMVTLENIVPNTSIFFTDNEWNGSVFNGGESYHQWDSGTAIIPAGTVIRFSAIDSATLLGSSVGTFTRATVAGSANFGISATEETIYVYEGTSATTPTIFLAAITNTSFGSVTSGVLTGTGLSIGDRAIQLGNAGDFAEYTGPRDNQTNFLSYISAVSNISNWNNPGDGVFNTTVPNTTAFTAVPEPSMVSLLGALGLFSIVRRRR